LVTFVTDENARKGIEIVVVGRMVVVAVLTRGGVRVLIRKAALTATRVTAGMPVLLLQRRGSNRGECDEIGIKRIQGQEAVVAGNVVHQQ
jgi:hypothetical protein